MLLTREDILNADDLPYKEIEVPEWGGNVRIRTMTGAERAAFEKTVYDIGDDNKLEMDRDNYRHKLISFCLVDEDNNRIFTDRDIEALAKKSAKAINRVFDIAQEMNGLTRESQERIEKNLPGEG